MTLPLSAGSVDQLTMMAAMLGVALAAWLWLRGRPFVALVLWCLVIAFVPVWFGVTIWFYFMPASLIGMLVVASLLPGVPRLTWVDLGVFALFAVCLAPMLIGLSTLSSIFTVLVQWMLAFLVGRLLTDRVGIGRTYTVVATTFTAVGAFSVMEFLLSWNPYMDLARPSPLYATWGNLQERGGIVRAEWAFGHSIALGACLAMAIPLALAAPVRLQLRIAMVLTMMAGAVVSFSRIGMISSVIGVVLSLIFLREGLPSKVRAAVTVGLVGVAAVAVPLVTRTFAEAGTEAAGSASYRGDLVSLLSSISVTGFTDKARRAANGELYFGNFQSIDSALILLGLVYGWVAIVVAVILLGSAVGMVVRRRATPATIAVVAQIPALATVALITQYGMFFWFVAGLAVTHQAAMSADARGRSSAGDAGLPGLPGLPENVSGPHRIR